MLGEILISLTPSEETSSLLEGFLLKKAEESFFPGFALLLCCCSGVMSKASGETRHKELKAAGKH